MFKGDQSYLMIQISKDEKEAILKKFPGVGIVRTVKQKSKRHRYYMEERKDAMYELRWIRGEIKNDKKYNGKNRQRKEYHNGKQTDGSVIRYGS